VVVVAAHRSMAVLLLLQVVQVAVETEAFTQVVRVVLGRQTQVVGAVVVLVRLAQVTTVAQEVLGL
jgi:hypothetical protein